MNLSSEKGVNNLEQIGSLLSSSLLSKIKLFTLHTINSSNIHMPR